MFGMFVVRECWIGNHGDPRKKKEVKFCYKHAEDKADWRRGSNMDQELRWNSCNCAMAQRVRAPAVVTFKSIAIPTMGGTSSSKFRLRGLSAAIHLPWVKDSDDRAP